MRMVYLEPRACDLAVGPGVNVYRVGDGVPERVAGGGALREVERPCAIRGACRERVAHRGLARALQPHTTCERGRSRAEARP